jgi:GTP pyrophosphokinase
MKGVRGMTEEMRKKIGERIRVARTTRAKRHGEEGVLSQEKLGEKLGVSFQAVSTWERGEFVPDPDHLPALSEELDISLNALLSETDPGWKLKPVNYDPEHMYTFVKGRAQVLGLKQTLAALPVMRERHRKSGKQRWSRFGFAVLYEAHPLTLACHALALGIRDDGVLAACLLHDVVEDTGTSPEELKELIPELDEHTLETVILVSKNRCDRGDPDWEKKYYRNIRRNPAACLVKVLDRVNNVAGMADGFGREWMVRYILETEEYYPDLLEALKKSEWNDAWWLLRYQLLTMTETCKRLL